MFAATEFNAQGHYGKHSNAAIGFYHGMVVTDEGRLEQIQLTGTDDSPYVLRIRGGQWLDGNGPMRFMNSATWGGARSHARDRNNAVFGESGTVLLASRVKVGEEILIPYNFKNKVSPLPVPHLEIINSALFRGSPPPRGGRSTIVTGPEVVLVGTALHQILRRSMTPLLMWIPP